MPTVDEMRTAAAIQQLPKRLDELVRAVEELTAATALAADVAVAAVPDTAKLLREARKR